jgi:hypothetical protein
MPQPKLIIRCRIEELPSLGGFLIASLQTDLADFTLFSPDFDATYLTNVGSQLLSITELIQPKTLTAELKVITLRIYTNMNALGQKLDFLEGYIKRASGLTVALKDFQISAIRKAKNNGDVEALGTALSYTLSLVNNPTNKPLILAKGYTAAQNTALVDIKDQLLADNILQNAKVNERNNLVTTNYSAINDFWKLLMDISDAGKRIYRSSNKKDDYTINVLIRRMRQELLRNKFIGDITSNGSPLNGASVELIPVLGGRRRTTKSKATGKFEIKSITAADYIANITAPAKITQSTPITIVAGQTLTQNFNLIDA